MSDPEGVELDDLRAAHRHAVKLIRMPGNGASKWSMLEQGWSVLRVLFPVAGT